MNITSIRLAMALIASLLFISGAAQAQSDKPVPYQEGLHYFAIEDASESVGDRVCLSGSRVVQLPVHALQHL